jgi:hypothetical protein
MKTEDVIGLLKFNIEMFEGYKPTPFNGVESALANFRESLAEWERHAAGEISRDEMSYRARSWAQTMPAWGTYGT